MFDWMDSYGFPPSDASHDSGEVPKALPAPPPPINPYEKIIVAKEVHPGVVWVVEVMRGDQTDYEARGMCHFPATARLIGTFEVKL